MTTETVLILLMMVLQAAMFLYMMLMYREFKWHDDYEDERSKNNINTSEKIIKALEAEKEIYELITQQYHDIFAQYKNILEAWKEVCNDFQKLGEDYDNIYEEFKLTNDRMKCIADILEPWTIDSAQLEKLEEEFPTDPNFPDFLQIDEELIKEGERT